MRRPQLLVKLAGHRSVDLQKAGPSLPLSLGNLQPFLYVSCACNRRRYTTRD